MLFPRVKNPLFTSKVVVFFFMVAALMFMGLFRKRRPSPTACIFSLSSEQVFCKSSPNGILDFFNEDRFSSRVDFSLPIIEVRSLKSIFGKNQRITYDTAMYLLTAVIKREQYKAICFDVFKELSNLDRSYDLKLRSLKREILDRFVYLHYLSLNVNRTVFVTTQTSLNNLPLVFKLARKSKKVMIWYSTNSKPIYAVDDHNRKLLDFECIVEDVDEHWVWDMDDVKFLGMSGIVNSIALGSLLFQEREFGNKSLDKFVVTYFDVTPFSASSGFYSEKNTIAVLENVAFFASQMNRKYPGVFELRIKPKRKYSKRHSKIYISKIKEISNHLPISMIPASANLYKTVSESDYVLSIPFSSPAILAKELGVKTAFIATGITGWEIPEASNNVAVEFDLTSLVSKVSNLIELKFNG